MNMLKLPAGRAKRNVEHVYLIHDDDDDDDDDKRGINEESQTVLSGSPNPAVQIEIPQYFKIGTHVHAAFSCKMSQMIFPDHR